MHYDKCRSKCSPEITKARKMELVACGTVRSLTFWLGSLEPTTELITQSEPWCLQPNGTLDVKLNAPHAFRTVPQKLCLQITNILSRRRLHFAVLG
jgi:hypothetical protein